ncbi:hypothetical protein HJFPF1_01184 [Paramyrothecium foliicola]|nr:hypothetical protein HJFPF1_01184 [Paramyrothecium foliicola]
MKAMSQTQLHEQPRSSSLPSISQAELFAFHESHFSDHANTDFKARFLSPPGQNPSPGDVADDVWEDYVEEDELGYYEDGVKRTLTDEQIQIFRHSELEALRRQQEKGSKNGDILLTTDAATGDLDGFTLPHNGAEASSSDMTKRKKKKGSKRSRPEPKPDLRKRTWDVVEAGLDTLNYD